MRLTNAKCWVWSHKIVIKCFSKPSTVQLCSKGSSWSRDKCRGGRVCENQTISISGSWLSLCCMLKNSWMSFYRTQTFVVQSGLLFCCYFDWFPECNLMVPKSGLKAIALHNPTVYVCWVSPQTKCSGKAYEAVKYWIFVQLIPNMLHLVGLWRVCWGNYHSPTGMFPFSYSRRKRQ